MRVQNFFAYLVSHPTARIVLSGAVVVVLIVGGYLVWRSLPLPGPTPTNFTECAAHYKVSGTLPKTCHVPWGKTFEQYDGTFNVVGNTIRLDLPPLPYINTSPFTVHGSAQASWFGSDKTLEIKLLAGGGEVIAAAKATQDPLPPGMKPGADVGFSATLTFKVPAEQTQGALVFKSASTTQTLVVPVVF